MAKRESKIKRIFRDELRSYLESEGGNGGHGDGFRNWIHKKFENDPYTFAEDMQGLLDNTAKVVWSEDTRRPESVQADLFTIAGEPVQPMYTFPDESVKGGHRKVLAKYATVGNVREDAILTMRKGAETSAQGEDKMRRADALAKLSRGNMMMPLIDLADEKETATAESANADTPNKRKPKGSEDHVPA